MDLIITHSNLDFDGLSSLVAAKKLYPKARIVLPSSMEKSVREFMLFYGDELGSIRESECALEGIDKLIIVETRFKSRLGKFSELADNPKIEKHLYDHHPRTRYDIRGKEDVSKNVGSTTSILVELIRKRNINITPFEATVMSLGIYEDTGFFSFPTTTKLDLEMTGFLLSKGANINTIVHYLKHAIGEENLNILSALINSIRLYCINGIDIGIILFTYPKYIEDLGALANKIIDILDIEGLFIIAKTDSKVQFTARSRNPRLDVNKTMKHFEGGGHITAASAFIKEKNPENLKEKLLEILHKQLKPRLFASDIMNYPVKTVKLKEPLDKAKKIMETYDIQYLPVMEKDKVVGMISRREVAKAEKRGFLHSKVKGYMKPRLISIKPDVPLHEIRTIMLTSNLSSIAVIKEDELVGIVSRSDLLKDTFKDAKLSSSEVLKIPVSSLNIKDKLLKKVPKVIMNRLKLIGMLSQKSNYHSFLVGGFVRDFLLGVKNFDLDIVVEADAIRFARLFADTVNGALVTYEKFGTATVIMKDKSKVDFATAREEYYEYPAALPTVEFGTIKQDLFRRDFTINAMAVRLNKENFGELLDFFGGLKDLKNRKVKVLHKISFIDDPTRIFRAVRFEQRYNFKIEPYTENLIKNAIELKMFERISKQRLREELILILSEDNPIKAIRRMAQLNEIRFIHPAIKFNKEMLGLLHSAHKVVGWFESGYAKRKLERWLIYFMVLINGLTKRQLDEVITKFVFKKGDSKRLVSTNACSEVGYKRLSTKTALKPSEIFKMLEDLSFETIAYIVTESHCNKKVLQRVASFLKAYNGTKLSITGKDLKALGLKPGPEFKTILKKVLYAKLDRNLKTKTEEFEFLTNMLSRSKCL
ncbi:MAG: CBS domain-containing protein [Candidatus Omnitrophota bacterium]